MSSHEIRGIDLIVLDVDGTLACPLLDYTRGFQRLYDRALAQALQCSLAEACLVTDHYRRHAGGRGEQAFYDEHLEEVTSMLLPGLKLPALARPLGATPIFPAFDDVDPAAYYRRDDGVIDAVAQWRRRRKLVVAITNSAETLSRRILTAIGFDADRDFDAYIPWRRDDETPPKLPDGGAVIASQLCAYGVPPQRAISIGDSPHHDILPAHALGMRTSLVGTQSLPIDVIRVASVAELDFP